MKNLKKIFLLCFVAMTIFFVEAAGRYPHYDKEVVDGIEWHYTANNGEACVMSKSNGKSGIPSSTSGAIIIPVMLGDNLVVDIGSRAFKDCDLLTTVTIPESVTNIWPYAFYGCDSITNIVIPNKVTNVRGQAFYRCSSLANVIIGNSVTNIGGWAFTDCSSLKSVIVPNSVINIGSAAFRDCISLERVYIMDLEAWCAVNFGDYESNPLCNNGKLYLNDNLVTDLKVPNSVIEIRDYAFTGCSSFMDVVIGNGVTNIGRYTFGGCASLTNVLLSSSLKRINNYAFHQCSKLDNVIVPKNVTYIGTNAFQKCTSFRNVYFEGAPPSAYDAFVSVASNAHGYYKEEYKKEWESVIGNDGKWNGLIMGPAVQPKLSIAEVDWIDGSIKLDWSKTELGENVTWPCILYRGTTDDFNSAIPITDELTDTNFTDKEFLKVKPVVEPLYYWVKPVNSEIPYVASEVLRTRYRSGLFVGFSEYGNNPATGKPWQSAYPSILYTTESIANLFDTFGFESDFLRNPSSQMLSRVIAEKATECKKGDIFVLWIFTHGGTMLTQDGRKTWLTMKPYLDRYFSSQMANDVSAFKRGTALVPIIYACHSGGMLDLSDVSATFDIMELINSGLAQCHSAQGGVAACSSKVTSPAVNGSATDIDSFARFFIDGVDYADNGDGNLTLHEMVMYIQRQQRLFTPYAIAEEVNNGMLNDSLIMRENAKKVTGVPPSKPTGLRFTENNNGSVTFAWDAAPGAKWYSDQGIVPNKNGFVYETSVTYDGMVFRLGDSYTFTVYAGNESGSSDGASITYSPSKDLVRLKASSNLSDGIMLTWDTNIGKGVVSTWVLMQNGGWFTSDARIATVGGDQKNYFHNVADFKEHEYWIEGYDNTGILRVSSSIVAGKRVEVLSPALSISPSSIEISADCEGLEGRYFAVDVTADQEWSFRISDNSFCKDCFVDKSNKGRIYLYCMKNETPNTRSTVITVTMSKSDGSSIEKECTIYQRGNEEAHLYEGSISRWRRAMGDLSENEFLTGRNDSGIPYLMCYAFQGNIADDEVPQLKIEMDSNGNPSVSMPVQNPLTSLDVEVKLECSVDLQTWRSVVEDKDIELSENARREIHYPRKKGNTEFYRFKVELR